MILVWVGVLTIAGPASAAALRLDFTLEPVDPPADPSVVVARVRGLSFVDEKGKPRWTVAPPRGLTSFLTDRTNATTYLAHPDAAPERMGLFTLVREKEVIAYVQEHLLVFAAKDGKLLFEQAQGMAGFGALSYQHADATLTCPAGRSTRRVANEPFLIGCGDRIVLFFVQGFAVFATAPWKHLHTEMFPDVPQSWSYSKAGVSLNLARLD